MVFYNNAPSRYKVSYSKPIDSFLNPHLAKQKERERELEEMQYKLKMAAMQKQLGGYSNQPRSAQPARPAQSVQQPRVISTPTQPRTVSSNLKAGNTTTIQDKGAEEAAKAAYDLGAGQLKDTYDKTVRSTMNDMNRRGLFGSSVASDDMANVNKNYSDSLAQLASRIKSNQYSLQGQNISNLSGLQNMDTSLADLGIRQKDLGLRQQDAALKQKAYDDDRMEKLLFM